MARLSSNLTGTRGPRTCTVHLAEGVVVADVERGDFGGLRRPSCRLPTLPSPVLRRRSSSAMAKTRVVAAMVANRADAGAADFEPVDNSKTSRHKPTLEC